MTTQREIATTLTQKMQLGLAGNERGIAKKYTTSNEAYQLYLKGRFHWAKRKKDDMPPIVTESARAYSIESMASPPSFSGASAGSARSSLASASTSSTSVPSVGMAKTSNGLDIANSGLPPIAFQEP